MARVRKMGPEPIPIPDSFTVSWYESKKERRKTDPEIAEELHISRSLLDKWKTIVGCEPYKYTKLAGRKTKIDNNLILELHNQGISSNAIAKMVGVADGGTIRYHLRKLKSKTY
jgi:ATP/maltotriose-dependent transcriptional regulator MalT